MCKIITFILEHDMLKDRVVGSILLVIGRASHSSIIIIIICNTRKQPIYIVYSL